MTNNLIINNIFQQAKVTTKKPAAKKATGGPKKAQLRGKAQKKKVSLSFTIDCTHPVEDNIMDVASFVSFVIVFSSIYIHCWIISN